MNHKIEIPAEEVKKIEKFVTDGRFKDLNDFVNQAVRLMIYAEDNKDRFMNVVTIDKKK